MIYNIDPAIFSSTYAIPTDVADKYLKLATHTQLKVMLYFMRNISDGIDAQKISQVLSIHVDEVEDALLFWAQCGVLKSEQAKKEAQPKKVDINSQMPSRSDVIRRGLEDDGLKFLLREAQLKFGRNLKQNESQLLVSLYDDYGMDASVILLLLQYASREGKCNLSFVKKTAVHWLNAGVETVVDAERLIAESVKQNLAWSIVQKVFGIDKRSPSTKELEYSNLWINEYEFNTTMLKAAYDICVDAKGKFIMSYIATILERWHKDGIKTTEQLAAQKPKTKVTGKTDYAGYDLDLFEKMLNKDD